MKFSVRSVAVAVAVLAVDCFVLRYAFANGFRGFFVSLAVLPMVNILAIGLYLASTRESARNPELLRFEFAGAVTTSILAVCLIAAPESWLYRIDESTRQRLMASAAFRGLLDGLGTPSLKFVAQCFLGVVTTALLFTPWLLLVSWGSARRRMQSHRFETHP